MAENPLPHDDRRRAERFTPADAHVDARPFAVRGAKVEARKTSVFGLLAGKDAGGPVLDVSRLGLRFIATEKMALKTRVTLVVSFAKAKAPLKCHAIVKWAYAHTEPGKFVIGVEFDPLNEAQLKLVDEAK